jgi:hypothetical protein
LAFTDRGNKLCCDECSLKFSETIENEKWWIGYIRVYVMFITHTARELGGFFFLLKL